MEYMPRGNATDVCAGLEAYNEASNLNSQQAYFGTNLALFLVFFAMALATMVGVWYTRNHARFIKVRPVFISTGGLAAAVTYVSACTLPFAFLPGVGYFACLHMLLGQIIGACAIALSVMLRLILISMEAQFAAVATKYAAALEADSMSPSSQAASVSSRASGFFAKQVRAFFTLFSFVVGRIKLEEISLQDTVNVREYYDMFAITLALPLVFAIIVIVLVVPQYYACQMQCRSMFLETEIGFLLLVVFYMLVDLRVAYLAYLAVGWDDKGTIYEMASTTFCAGVFVLIIVAVAIADPGGQALRHEFNWQCLGFITGCIYLWTTFGANFLHVWQESRRVAIENRDQEQFRLLVMMEEILESSEEVREDFRAFAVTQYVVEHVQFLEDVDQFKRMYYQKTETWRTSKVNLLIKKYITVGADLEINISSATREQIIQEQHSSASFEIFDRAYTQILDVVRNGVWRDFVRGRKASLTNRIKNSKVLEASFTKRLGVSPAFPSTISSLTPFRPTSSTNSDFKL